MGKIYNLARVNTATTGTGTMTLGSAVSGYLTLANAGVSDGDNVVYAINDGANSEIGYGVYTAAGTTLTRAFIVNSTSGGANISLSGTAQVFITAEAGMIANNTEDNTFQKALIVGTDSSGGGAFTCLLVHGWAGTDNNLELIRWSNDQFPTAFTFAKSRGTSNGVFTTVNLNDDIGIFVFKGADGSTISDSVFMSASVDGTPAAGVIPGRWTLGTADAAGAMQNRIIVDKAGLITVQANGSLKLAAGTTTVAPLILQSGTNLTTAAAGANEFDGKVYYQTAVASARQVVDTEQVQVLSGTRTFTNNTSAQAIFNASATGALTVAASTTYEFECAVSIASLSGSAHTLSFSFGGGATFTACHYFFTGAAAATVATPTAALTGWIAVATASIIVASSSLAGATFYLRGIMRINGAGTIIPQITQGTNSTAAVVQIDSFFRCWPIGTNTVTNVGNWS